MNKMKTSHEALDRLMNSFLLKLVKFKLINLL